jgi:hypothetical protein
MKTLKLRSDDVVLLSFPNQTLLPQQVKPMADALAAALRVPVLPIVGCDKILVMRGILPNVRTEPRPGETQQNRK